jgi:hypothetical protein
LFPDGIPPGLILKKASPNALDMGNQLRIVDLLPGSNVDFPRQQRTIDC